MQKQNWEEWTERINRSAESVTVPDSLKPEAVQQMLDKRKKRSRSRKTAGIAAAIAVLVITAAAYGLNTGTGDAGDNQTGQISTRQNDTETGTKVTVKKEKIGTFTLAKSYQDVYKAVQKSEKELLEGDVTGADEASGDSLKSSASDHSDTNLQVEGVDEGDIVKNDGNYLYVLSDDRVTIVDIRSKDMPECSVIRPEMGESDALLELYVDNNSLYVIKQEWKTQDKEDTQKDAAYCGMEEKTVTVLLTYDISDRTSPVLTGTMKMDGSYHHSRKAGDFIYLFTQVGVSRAEKDWKDQVIPEIGGEKADAGCFYVQNNSSVEEIMASVNVKEPSKTVDRMVLLGAGQDLYMGTGAIYLYQDASNFGQKTKIMKFSYENGKFSAAAETTVKGWVRDTFAIAESAGQLRVLTTESSKPLSENRLYILDENLEKIGALEHIATGEEVYAARYIGDIAYFITYYNTDPLFAVDISDPANPKALGEVKMTGYSDYLHPFGDGLLLGIGYETRAKSGERTGVKLTMYDISDPMDLKIIDSVTIKGDSCNAADDYKCAFVDTARGLVGFGTEVWTEEINSNACLLYQWDGKTFVNKIYTQNVAKDDGSGMMTLGGIWRMRSLSAGDTFYQLQETAQGGFTLTSYDMKHDFCQIHTAEY